MPVHHVGAEACAGRVGDAIFLLLPFLFQDALINAAQHLLRLIKCVRGFLDRLGQSLPRPLGYNWIVFAAEVHGALVVIQVAIEKPQRRVLQRRLDHLAGDVIGPGKHLPLVAGFAGGNLF